MTDQLTSNPCNVCLGMGDTPNCICGGAGTEAEELVGLRKECLRLRAELAEARSPTYALHLAEARDACDLAIKRIRIVEAELAEAKARLVAMNVTTNCWRCSAPYAMGASNCPACQAFNANVHFDKAQQQREADIAREGDAA